MLNPAPTLIAETTSAPIPPSDQGRDSIVLAHVSDIHFLRAHSASAEPSADDDLRSEVVRSFEVMRERLGVIHGILISGDVAFSGREDEYQRADRWIRELCRAAGCSEEQVRSISGNHDVQRDVLRNSQHLRNAHLALRQSAKAGRWHDVEQQLQAYWRDDEAVRELLFSPLRQYNSFADKFLSGFHADQPFWEWDIALNDGSILKVRGINSALVSGPADDQGENKLVAGSHLFRLPRKSGVEYLVLCHHPPDWLWDASPVEDSLNSRARVHLFGHKHLQRTGKTTVGDFDSVRVYAGAVNPDAGGADYLPRFNCLALRVAGRGAERALKVTVHGRVWNAEATAFSDIPPQQYSLRLPAWEPTAAVASTPEPVSSIFPEPLQIVSDPLQVLASDAAKVRVAKASRRLAYRFLALPYVQRGEVTQVLKLTRNDDEGQPEPELFRRYFQRAVDSDQLPALWREVETRHPDGQAEPNPFTND